MSIRATKKVVLDAGHPSYVFPMQRYIKRESINSKVLHRKVSFIIGLIGNCSKKCYNFYKQILIN